MLAVVVGAATLPNFGVASAQTGDQYGQPTSSSSGYSVTAWLVTAAVIIAAALGVAWLVLRAARSPAK